jgi:hypothetical protein
MGADVGTYGAIGETDDGFWNEQGIDMDIY